MKDSAVRQADVEISTDTSEAKQMCQQPLGESRVIGPSDAVILRVPASYVDDFWSRIKPFIEAAGLEGRVLVVDDSIQVETVSK